MVHKKKDEEIIDSTSIRDIVLAIDESTIKDNHLEKDDLQKKDNLLPSTIKDNDEINDLTSISPTSTTIDSHKDLE